jgi:hypothetical protein
MTSNDGYNPLDTTNLADSLANALIKEDPLPMSEISMFDGSGIYAIYYTGSFPAYKAISDANADGAFTTPIYTGKAVPEGSRKGNPVVTKSSRPLYKRVREHRNSIMAASNLDIDDFRFRVLVTDILWISLGESMMINRFAPVWNAVVDGFGNHSEGAGRHAGERTRWDTIHPGRASASKLQARRENVQAIETDIEQYLAARLP